MLIIYLTIKDTFKNIYIVSGDITWKKGINQIGIIFLIEQTFRDAIHGGKFKHISSRGVDEKQDSLCKFTRLDSG